jgi:hypothetical protein
MSDALLVSIAALIFVGAPLAAIAWTIFLERRAPDEPQEPGDHAHHPDSIEQARRANGKDVAQ